MLKIYFNKLTKKIKLFYSFLWRKFFTPQFPVSESVWINIGCGLVEDPRFINVDARPLKHVHIVTQTPALMEFQDNYADLIYSSHVLEHFSHTIVIEVLENWYRILKPGGILRLSVPDFDKLVDKYISKKRKLNSILGFLMGEQTYAYNYHYTAFNRESLLDILKTVGFLDVREWNPKDLNDWPEDTSHREDVSLNLEAVKTFH